MSNPADKGNSDYLARMSLYETLLAEVSKAYVALKYTADTPLFKLSTDWWFILVAMIGALAVTGGVWLIMRKTKYFYEISSGAQKDRITANPKMQQFSQIS